MEKVNNLLKIFLQIDMSENVVNVMNKRLR